MPRLRRSRTSYWQPKRGKKQGREVGQSPIHGTNAVGYSADDVGPNTNNETSEQVMSDNVLDHTYSSPSVPGPSNLNTNPRRNYWTGRRGIHGRDRIRQARSPTRDIHHSTEQQLLRDIIDVGQPSDKVESRSISPIIDEVVVRSSSPEHRIEGTVEEETLPNDNDLNNFVSEPASEEVEEKLLDLSLSGNEKSILSLTHKMIRLNIPQTWRCIPSNKGLSLSLFCKDKTLLAVQRQIVIGHDGSVQIAVHRRAVKKEHLEEILSGVPPAVSLTDDTWKEYSNRAIALTRRLDSYEICCGADNDKYKDLWKPSESAYIDLNPYGELKYKESLRSHECDFIINCKKWRCYHCAKIQESLKKKRTSHQGSEYNPNTANIHLDEAQKLAKLSNQQAELKAKQREINQLQKVEESLQKDGVTVDKEMHKFLTETFQTAETSSGSVFEKFHPLQQLFFQQQIKNAKVKGPSGVKWHPAIIRLALRIRSLSKSAYETLRASGMNSLPSDSTLFEYSHVADAQEGCKLETLDKIAQKLSKCKNKYQTYHVIMFDEMHVSKNLVYRKATGEIIGYVKLSNVEQELHDLDTFINSDDTGTVKASDASPPIATQMLTFMVKGVANDVRETVATFTTNKLVAQELYSRFWDVMVQLEKRGIRIVAAVCDGSSVNRSFIKLHVPHTKLPSGVVFDTINLCSDGRILYFLSDAPHLIKTARNNFYKSGYGPTFSRLLTINGQHIVWQTIRKMFTGEVSKNWRRCRKLNGQNVNLNSYSVMKVSYAAEVLSNTVATDLELMSWEGTEETVKFIRKFNDFFDMLNGAFSEHHIVTKNPNLAPYRDINDPRFDKLDDFLTYLKDWQVQVDGLGNPPKEKEKMVLSRETLEGIELTIKGFTGATKFLLSEGAKFINARVFCQDPLEQYHSKQRAHEGGSSNPNVQQFLHTDRKVEVLRDVSDASVRYRKGNVKAPDVNVQISDEPLAKRKKN